MSGWLDVGDGCVFLDMFMARRHIGSVPMCDRILLGPFPGAYRKKEIEVLERIGPLLFSKSIEYGEVYFYNPNDALCLMLDGDSGDKSEVELLDSEVEPLDDECNGEAMVLPGFPPLIRSDVP